MRLVYDLLSQASLLQRRLGTKSQNASESFHAVLWSLVPKEQHASLIAVKTALYEAVLRFNTDCCKATKEISAALGLQPRIILTSKIVVEATTESKNIKRESKVYSYKEQMEEIELKKELEAKKKSKVQEPELSKKQKEAMEAQLQKEHAVRLRIRKLAESVERALQLLGAALSAPAPTVCLHGAPLFPEVMQALTSLFSSRLAAPYVVQAFLGLKDVLFPPDLRHFGQWVGYLTLRLAGPCCPLDPRWTQEDLEECTQRVVGRLHDLTCGGSRRLGSPAFCFTFPLLRLVLASPDSGDQLVTQCLQVLSAHSFMRAREPLSLRLAQKVAVDVCFSISGLEGCSQAEVAEIKVLLSALYCPELVVRETALQRLSVYVDSKLLRRPGREKLLNSVKNAKRTRTAEYLLLAEVAPVAELRETSLPRLSKRTEAEMRRGACVCLLMLQLVLPTKEKDPSNALELASRVWVAKFDSKEEIQALAEKLWRELLLEPEPAMAGRLLGDVGHPHAEVRVAAAGALRALVAAFPDCFQEVLLRLMETYEKYLQRPEPIRDSFGRVLVESPPDVWEPRSGVGVALGQLASLVPTACVAQVMQFFVPLALSDPRPQVHKAMLDAAVALIDFHGNGAVHLLLPLFEKFLDEAPDDVSYDQVRQSVVILMGTLARHLDKEDHRVKPIVKKLIDTLATPSQQVQEAVASCLPPLIPAIKEEAPALVQKLLTQLLNSDQYGERRGAAYGLAGLVRGLGILSLKQLDIMNTLTEAVQDKKNARRKEGALLAFEMLCSVLGRLFEPYVVHVLPHLLLCFGDSNQYVRE
ncbi:hypothetical protein HPB47_021684, partial [Ixodes persulcatus]